MGKRSHPNRKPRSGDSKLCCRHFVTGGSDDTKNRGLTTAGTCCRSFGAESVQLQKLAASISRTPMPVIRHGHHGKNWQAHNFPCLCDHTHERRIVFWFFKTRHPSHRSSDNVEHFSCRTIAFGACHHRSLKTATQTKRYLILFLFILISLQWAKNKRFDCP